MRAFHWLAVGLLAAGPLSAQSPAKIYVTLPAEAKLEVDGVAVKQTGAVRKLITPPLADGKKGRYVFRATFARDGVVVINEHTVTVEGGKDAFVDLSRPGDTALADPEVMPRTDPKSKADLPPAVPYSATPPKVVTQMLKLAGVKDRDVVMDLGCGDGRIVVAAAKEFGAKKGIGIESSPDRVRLSKANAEKAGVADRVEIRAGDLLKLSDLSEASVVTLYLLPDINEKLKPVLRRTLKPGARVVSLNFDLGTDWRPDKEMTVQDEAGHDHVLYLWTIPEAKKAEPKKDPPPAAKSGEGKKDTPKLTVPYVPSPLGVVDEMLKLAGVKEADVVYDLGCGDGRIVVAAVKTFKAKKGVGVDIDPDRIKDSVKTAKDAGVQDKVEFREGDVLQIKDVSAATVVCLYMLPALNEQLQPMLRRTLKPGSRIVSLDFLMGNDFPPDREVKVKDESGEEHTLYLWTIPEPKK